VSSTVLIAAPEHLQALKSRQDLMSAQAFPDAEALRALDVITRQRPGVVAPRGTALINRIKADPALSACEIRIVAHDADTSRVSARPEPAVAVAEPPVAAPLDQRGTRRAPRFRVVEGIEVMVDGKPASLVDLSVVGAMVVSPTILRPNQRLRMSLPDATRPIRFNAGVAWAAFEMPKTGPRYRAGIEFFDADREAVGRFIESYKK
jgi:hypothetical protein